MKKLKTPDEIITAVFEPLLEKIKRSSIKDFGTIQFKFTHLDEELGYYLDIQQDNQCFKAGLVQNPRVTVQSSLFTWLAISSNRLNPVLAVVTGKLKIQGDQKYFSKMVSGVNLDIDMTNYADPVTTFEMDPTDSWEKPKKILIINSSPRGKNGYTEFYQSFLIKGFEKHYVKIEQVYLKDLKISGCTGCFNCWLSGSGDCIFDEKDDFRQLQDKYQAFDLIVFAFPLYTDGMPGMLKDFFDRSVCKNHPFMTEGIGKIRHPRRSKVKQAIVVLGISGFIEQEVFTAVNYHFKAVSHNGHFPIISQIYRSGAMYLYNNPLEYQKLLEITDSLIKAGEEIIAYGKIQKKTINIITQKIASKEDFIKNSNYFWNNKINQNEKTY